MNPVRACRSTTVSVLASLVVLAGGCAHIVEAGPPPPDENGHFLPLTKPMILLGDTQEHEATGFPLHANDGAVDTYVEVAQRPPEQPLFGRRIMEWVLSQHPEEPTVHLGDVLDMSCASELIRMRQFVINARQESAILPGNHDGLMFGIFNYKFAGRMLEKAGRAWYLGCLRGAPEAAGAVDPHEAVVTKRDFIAGYLGVLAGDAHNPLPVPQPARSGDARISWTNPRPGAFLEAIEARLHDEDLYSNSFIAQKMRVPRAPGATRGVVMIGLDTNQVGVAVSILDTVRGLSPGDIGHVRADQVDAIRPWLDEAHRANDIVVFAGHHNWNRLSFSSQARIAAAMWRLNHPLVYVSAHTHRGFWASHRIGDRPLLELNVSSLSDWPIAYRRVTFALDAGAQRLKVTAAVMPNDGRPVASDRDLLTAWERLTCEPTGYAAWRLEAQERLVVQRQRDARGSLLSWLYEGLGEQCESCQQALYESGLRYQDALLEAILTLYHDFWTIVPRVAALGDGGVCGKLALPVCVGRLRAERPASLPETMDLFRRRARLIDAVNTELDGIENPRVRDYMTCRAVIAARTDYELTPEDTRRGRGEDQRRRQDFFRTEATVGMR